ncbi:AAA family ATPase [Pseudomonas sp. zjy_15]|uniref:AAA family ATPase n=1 Tax=Pseudomonas sp. zjy_15 TaxID=3367265 RepID=UPI00370B9282
MNDKPTPIIKKLTIKGFKSIWQDSLDLGQMNVFIGTNGAGKSNLLEAIAMMSCAIEGGIDYERLQRRGARLSSSAVFRSAFKNKNRTSVFKLEADFGELAYSLSMNAEDGFRYLAESIKTAEGKIVAGRSNNGATIRGLSLKSKLESTKGIFPTLEAYQAINGDSQELVEPLASLVKYAIFAPTTPILRGVEQDSSAKEPLGLYGGNLANALNEVIIEHHKNKTSDLLRFFKLMNWVQSFVTTNETDPELVSGQVSVSGRKIKFMDKFMKANFNKLYAYDVSEGTLYVMFLLVLLGHEDSPDFFALDNIDTALNPGLVRELIHQVAIILSKKPHKQIFLTTHNPSTLDAVDLFDDTHRLFVVERDKDGHTKSRRIQPPEGMSREVWEEKYYGMKLSEIWLSGAIGGLPQGF